jgi:alpha-ketoglutarate-dependent taurine dioxygenase
MDIDISHRSLRELPLVVDPRNAGEKLDLGGLLTSRKAWILRSLSKHGAVLFRGFEVSTIEEFENVARSFSGNELLNYAGGASPRSALGGGVYTSTEYPAHLTLALHNELSYSKTYPEYLYFFCVTAPERGGETTLGDSRRIFRRIPTAISREFIEKGILYVRNLTFRGDPGYTWPEVFDSDSREHVEKYCDSIGADFEWQSDGGVKLYQKGPATVFHPRTGEQVWFNQAHGFHPTELEPSVYEAIVASGGRFRLESYFGDGSPIPKEMLDEIREILRSETVKHKWQKNDLLIVDNLLSAHGRAPVLGPRRIALAMS